MITRDLLDRREALRAAIQREQRRSADDLCAQAHNRFASLGQQLQDLQNRVENGGRLSPGDLGNIRYSTVENVRSSVQSLIRHACEIHAAEAQLRAELAEVERELGLVPVVPVTVTVHPVPPAAPAAPTDPMPLTAAYFGLRPAGEDSTP